MTEMKIQQFAMAGECFEITLADASEREKAHQWIQVSLAKKFDTAQPLSRVQAKVLRAAQKLIDVEIARLLSLPENAREHLQLDDADLM